ncbi:hypothetical protein [Dongia deserti]|uniref:hypothetical protein n=1 Tax=Dongia deserti TaxID=2268030 RepID=UPI0013C5273C|nr:hypothetical protein [Dongia deserti]
MVQSPMLKHAIESLEQGLAHFLEGTERSRKFALLHIDNAVELMLKEKCVVLGKSIYKGDGTTLTIHEAFNSLKKEGVSIPEQPRLEELHDLRNTIQHKGLVPDSLTTKFHVEVAYSFTKRFLEAELSIPLADALPPQYRLFMEGVTPQSNAQTSELSEHIDAEAATVLSTALKEAWKAANPMSQVVAGYSVLEQVVRMLGDVDPTGKRIRFRTTLRDAAARTGADKLKFDKKLNEVFAIRGQALRPDHSVTEIEAIRLLRAVESIVKMLGLKAKASKPGIGGPARASKVSGDALGSIAKARAARPEA